MARTVKEYQKTHTPKEFVSRPHYFEIGDFVTFFLANEPCVAKRIDDLLTVYHSIAEPERLVGCKIKGVRRLVEEFGSLGLTVSHESAKFGLFFVTALKTKNEVEDREHYRQAATLMKDVPIDLASMGFTPCC